MKVSKVSNDKLREVRRGLGPKATSVSIQQVLHKQTGVMLDESTIRGRFVAMGEPLRGKMMESDDVKLGTQEDTSAKRPSAKTFAIKNYQVAEQFKHLIPRADMFTGYVERPIDLRLAMQYEASKFPLTQGKQGTGKTFSHHYFAYKANLPMFLISCHDEMKLHKLYGDKTIENGSIKYRESSFVQATQMPSVILFDEVNAVSNANSFDFHALLQNRELFVKDADDGKGKWFKLHPDCKIGFSMNPKSQKYIGGHIKPSNFLGRCTFVTFPDFSKPQIRQAVKKNHPSLPEKDMAKFVEYYHALTQTIEQAKLPIDISIRQLNNAIDLYKIGMDLKDALDDSISGMLDAVSQPKAKDSFLRIGQAIWEELKGAK